MVRAADRGHDALRTYSGSLFVVLPCALNKNAYFCRCFFRLWFSCSRWCVLHSDPCVAMEFIPDLYCELREVTPIVASILCTHTLEADLLLQ